MSKKQHIAQIKLERYVLNELPQAEMERIAELVSHDSEIAQRVNLIHQSNSAIAEQYSDEWVTRQIRQKASAQAAVETTNVQPYSSVLVFSQHYIKQFSTIAVLLCTALMVFYYSGMRGADIRFKGGEPFLTIHKKVESGAITLADGDTVSQGDLLQVHYKSMKHEYGAILSQDGSGAITVHLPERGVKAARLTLNENISLEHSYELDDAPSFERFYFVTSDSTFFVDSVVDVLKRQNLTKTYVTVLPLSGGFSQHILTLYKRQYYEEP